MAQPTPIQIDFIHDANIKVACELAQQQGKFVFVEFTSPNCSACRRMELEVFPETEVATLINQNFISHKIDIAFNSDPIDVALEENLHPQFLPNICIFNTQQELLEQINGFKSKDNLIDILKNFLDKPQSSTIANQAPVFPKEGTFNDSKTLPPTPIIPDPKKFTIEQQQVSPSANASSGNSTLTTARNRIDNNETPTFAPPKLPSGTTIAQLPTTSQPLKESPVIVSDTPRAVDKGTSTSREPLTTEEPVIAQQQTEQQTLLEVAFNDPIYKGSKEQLKKLCYSYKDSRKNYQPYLSSYIDNYRDSLVTKDHKFIMEFSLSLDNPASQVLLSNIEAFKIRYGYKKVDHQITLAARQTLNIAINNGDGNPKMFNQLVKDIENAPIVNRDSLLFEIKCQYHQGTKDWENYHQICQTYFRVHKSDPDLLLGHAQVYMRHIDRPDMLSEAVKWAKQATMLEPSSMSYYVTGVLYEKLHEMELAQEYLNQAMEWVASEKSDNPFPKEALDRLSK